MKKIFSLLMIFIVLISLTACKIGDPGLIKDYELEKVSFKKASKTEWELQPIDEEYSYVSDFFHDDRDGSFLRIYHGEEQVYEEISNENFYDIKATRINNSIYLYYWQPETINDKWISIDYIVRLDENFNKTILLQESDWASDEFFFSETCIVCLKKELPEDPSTLVELDYEGQVINSKTFDMEFTQLFVDDGAYYLKKENQFYLFDFTNGLKLYDEIDISKRTYIRNLKFQNDTISYVAYHYNDESCVIYYHNGKEDRIILTIPNNDEDLAYSCGTATIVKEDIFIPVHVGVSGPMSIYSRVLVFHYDGETQQVKVIYLDKNCYSSHVIKNKMFIGRYRGESNGTSDGVFYSFDLEESASKIW